LAWDRVTPDQQSSRPDQPADESRQQAIDDAQAIAAALDRPLRLVGNQVPACVQQIRPAIAAERLVEVSNQV
jgi:hypothetical protein